MLASLSRILLTATLFCTISGVLVPCIAAKQELLKRVKDAQSEYEKKQDDSASIDWDDFRKLRNIQRELLVLKRDGQTYLPVAVYSAKVLKRGFDLSELVADDTIHVTEEYQYAPITYKAEDKFVVETAWDPGMLSRCDFYVGHPGQMHQDGYKSVVKIMRIGDAIMLPAKGASRDMLLFALVKPKNGDYIKFVFVVRAQDKSVKSNVPTKSNASK